MTIKHFKTKLKLAISAILVGLALYGVSVLNSLNDEGRYNSLPNKEKQVVDSLRRTGVEEGELRENISLMSSALDLLQGIQYNLGNQKDWDKRMKISFPEDFNLLKAQRIGSLGEEIALALDKLNKVNPKIFDTRETRAKLEQAKKELNAL